MTKLMKKMQSDMEARHASEVSGFKATHGEGGGEGGGGEEGKEGGTSTAMDDGVGGGATQRTHGSAEAVAE